jgi:proteasome accessory factor B
MLNIIKFFEYIYYLDMSSQKTERLINLTLALLASKRFLSKHEIFQKIPGYEGSNETKERMFERDKEELRKLGIDIEVNNADPLFEDDLGYLINPNTFQLNEAEFSQEELLLMTMATNFFRESAMSSTAKAALLKIHSLCGPTSTNEIFTPSFRIKEESSLLTELFEAIENRQEIQFTYNGKDRIVKPYGLILNRGFWYLVGQDFQIMKSFKLVRIQGSVITLKPKGIFQKPERFDLHNFLGKNENESSKVATVLIRKGTCLDLRARHIAINFDQEWDLVELPFDYEPEFIREILWYGADIFIKEPANLRDQLVQNLKELING